MVYLFTFSWYNREKHERKETMEEVKIDYRKESAETVLAVKKQVIAQYQKKVKTKEIVQNTGLCVNTVRETIRKFRQGGMEALEPKKEGRPQGVGMVLSEEQSNWVRKTIVDKTPDQLKLPCALWTRKAVRQLIIEHFGILLPLSTMGLYLKRWGFTCQKPSKRAAHQNAKAVEKWMTEEYPAIREQAKKEKAVIFWMDETGVQNCSNQVRGYAPKGQTPVLVTETKRMHVNMVSAITATGRLYFRFYRDAMNADLMKDFLERLLKDEGGRKVYMICDNLKVHHSKPVKEWLEEKKDSLSLFYLPSYAPEYNPDEYLNSDLKSNVALKPQARTVEDIQKSAEEFMTFLSETPDHVASYFEHDKLAYQRDTTDSINGNT